MKTSRPTYAVRVSIVAIICISVTVLAAGWSPAGWMGDRPLVRGLVRWASAPRLGFGGSPAPFAPAVTATKAAAFAPVSPSLPVGGDADADGKADPGDTIRYTVTVSDLTDPATGVHFADTPDPNTTLVGGSIIVSPLAINESYNSVGNMTLTSSAIAADCGTNPLRSVTCNDSLNGATLTGFGPAPGTANVMAPGGTVTTASNGSVVLNADGTFVYNPAAGFEGADTFWYTLTSPSGIAGTDNAQVTINVGGANGMVWFVSSAGGGGGRQNSPISLASFRLLNNGTGTNPASGDTIFLFEGAHPLTSTLILLATQKVIGQDTTGTLANLGAPTPQSGNSYPAVNNPTGTAVSITSTVAAVTLGSDNTLAGFTIGNSTTALIAAGSVGSLRVRDVIIGTNGQAIALTGGGTVVTDPTFTGFTSVSTTGGAFGINLSNIAGTLALGGGDLNGNIVMAFNVNGGSATITYSGTIRNSGARQVSIVNKTGGAVTLSGAVGGTGTGVFLDNNDQSPGVATMTFTGGLALSTGTNAAFTATNGGTVNVCDKNPCGSATAVVNTLATSTGTAVNVTNTTIGGSGLTFRSITSSGSGSANGIILNTTGSTGGLTVTGNGSTCTSAATCTGGTISNKTGADGTGNGIGIYLNNTANVSITLMKLNDFSNYAVRGTNVTGFTMSNCVIDGVNGNNGGADEGTIIFDGLFGTSLFSGDTIKGGIEDNFRIINSSGTSNVTIDNSTIRDTSTSASGNDNVNLRSTVNGSITAHITNSIFAATNGDHIQTIASDQSSMVIVATGNTLSGGGGGSALGQGITISGGSAAPVDSTEVVRFNISSNNMTGTISGGAININEGSGNGNWQGQINGNTIGNAGSACSGASASSGVRLENHSKGTLTGIVSNNLIHQTCGAGGGISLSAGDTTASGLGNGPLNATVTGNTVDTPGGSADHGVVLVGGAGVTDNTNQICLDLKNNTSEGSHVVGSSGFGYRIRQRFNQTVFLPGYGGANNNNAAVEAYFVARPNTAIAGDGGTYSVTNTVGVAPPNGPGGGFVNGGAQCAQPIVMAMNAVAPSGSLASTEAPRQNYSPLAFSSMAGAWSEESGPHTDSRTLPGETIGARVRSLAAPLLTLLQAAANGLSASLHASPQPPPVDVDVAATLPVGKTVRVVFDVTVNPVPVAVYSNQGTVTWTNAGSVLTNTATTPGDLFDTSTVLVSSSNPASQGDSITFTATVTPTQGAVTPDGTVQFKDGGSNLGAAVTCAPAPANTCTAQLTTTTLPAGTRSITAVYGPGTNHDTSTSNIVSQVNNACIATPITVTTNADSGAGSLRQAIVDACPGNTISFGAVAGSIDLISGQLTIDKHLTITGPGANLLTVQRTSGTSRIFSVGAGRTVNISGLTIAGGNAGPGAGLLNDHGTLTLANSTVSGNGDASTLGGAVFNDGSATGASLTIVNSTLSGNTSLDGGALYNQGLSGGTATSTITNSTISGNTAIDSGGGIHNVGSTVSSAALTITNSTITNNRADNDTSSTGTGGGLSTVTSTAVTLRNTIVAHNLVGASPSTAADDVAGALDTASSFNNLIGVDTGMTGVSHGVNANQVGTSGSPIDPRLATLANNGGSTFTHALLAGSLALDAGNDALAIGSTDQRGTGFARIRDAADANTTQTVDIGAFEADPSVEDIADKSTNEDTPLAFTFSVGDSASAFDSISATSSNTTLVPNANAVVTPATPSTRTLTLTPAADRVGTTTITVTATKTVAGTPLSMSDTFVLTVTAVNDPPTIDALANPPPIPQNAGTQTVNLTGIGPGGGESGQTLTVTATSNNTAVIPHPAVTYTSPNNTGSLSYAPVPGANGSAIVTVTVTDNGGGLNAITTTFTVTVTAAPTISNIADQQVPASTSAAIPFTVGDTETVATALTVTAVSSNQAVVPDGGLVVSSGGASRTLTLTPVPNTTGTATITVTVTDGDGLTASDTFVATVVPSLTINDTSVAEGDSGGVSLTFTVTLAGPSASLVSVFYATRQRTAIQGIDYAGAVDTVSFNPGVTGPSTFAVTVNGDTAAEINETLVVNLSGATGGAVITRAQGVGTITDNDATPERTAELASWARRVGVTASGGSLSKTGVTGWNAGASSTQSLLAGDGSVEFSVTSTEQIAVVGLSRGDANTDFSDVDFGIELYSGARFYLVEAGAYVGIGSFGAFDLGDRFGVTVTGGIVSYQKNGVTIHTSGVAAAYPLLVDTALYTPAMTIADVAIAGRLGRSVVWTNLAGATASGSGLTKTAGGGWNAGAASTRAIVSGDGAVEFTAPETTTQRLLGLSRDNATTDFSDIDFGILAAANGTFYVFESGVSRGMFGPYAADDRFQVAVEAGVVKYRRNGIDVYTSAVTPVYPLLVDTALFTPGATLTDVTLAGTFAADVTFGGAVGVGVSGNTLTKTAGLGWNAGAISTRALVKGEGFLEFTTSEATSHKVAGLSHGNTNTDFADVDFGVLLTSSGVVYVYESGTSRGVFGTYVAGDRFRVAVEGGVVKYRRNGVLFYTSVGVPAYPLLVDTALYSAAATVADVVLSGDLGEAVTWTATAGVSTSTGTLTKTGAPGWNAGAISTRAIASGDGFVSFTTNEATTHKLIGLSTGNTDSNYTDVDFAILLASNGTYYVFESGVSRGVFGGYLSSDRFQVAVEGAVVKYLRNGAVFYMSAVAPVYPLLVDTALFTPGATLRDVVLACTTVACQ